MVTKHGLFSLDLNSRDEARETEEGDGEQEVEQVIAGQADWGAGSIQSTLLTAVGSALQAAASQQLPLELAILFVCLYVVCTLKFAVLMPFFYLTQPFQNLGANFVSRSCNLFEEIENLKSH